MKSACILNKPEKIYFHVNREPISNEWWNKAKNLVEIKIKEPPEKIFDRKLIHPAHKSDIARIYILKEFGGIYLDIDIICKKPFNDLLKYKFVLGRQGIIRDTGLCNGVILSEAKTEFLDVWLNEYKKFRSKGVDKYWDEISVQRPMSLARKHPEMIHIESRKSFHYPLFFPSHLKKLFEKNIDYKKAYCHHLWESASKDKYLSKLTPEIIKTVDTTYNVIARRFL
ncbi:MAG: hypothetical protein JW917_04165 [Ignavibacteria bacterium]|nr:hypothetical protein [Ignavibacteria bacterium]